MRARSPPRELYYKGHNHAVCCGVAKAMANKSGKRVMALRSLGIIHLKSERRAARFQICTITHAPLSVSGINDWNCREDPHRSLEHSGLAQAHGVTRGLPKAKSAQGAQPILARKLALYSWRLATWQALPTPPTRPCILPTRQDRGAACGHGPRRLMSVRPRRGATTKPRSARN